MRNRIFCVEHDFESFMRIGFSLIRSDDEDQAAELSRLLDQKAYLEELNKKLEYVI